MQPERPQPILIVGAPRSGTTLLATMLNAHPDIFIANESKLLINLLPRQGGQRQSISRDKLLAEAAARGLGSHVRLSDLPPDSNAADLLRSVFEASAEANGKKRWGEKTAVAFRRLPALVNAYPDAHFIGLERDLEAVAASYSRINPSWGATGGVVHWLEFKQAIARQGPDFRCLLISYEELTEKPELTLRRVCEFVGEPFDASTLRYYETAQAQYLAQSPEFAGASRALYHSGVPTKSGLPTWLIARAKSYADTLAESGTVPIPIWFRTIRAFVRARVLFREISTDGIVSTLHKVGHRLS